MVYGDFKALPRRNAFDKSVHDNALEMASNPQYEEYLSGITSQGRRERGDRGRLPPPPPFAGAKAFFPC